MNLRTTCLVLFSCSVMALTGCQNVGNPLGGTTRMLQAMGRTVGLAANDKTRPIQLDSEEITRARTGAGMEQAMPPVPRTPGNAEQIAMAR